MEHPVLRPRGGQPVGGHRGRQRSTNHEAEISRPGGGNQARVKDTSHFLDYSHRICPIIGEWAAELGGERGRVDLRADMAFPQPVHEVEREFRRPTHGPLARVHRYASVSLGARNGSPISSARRSATVHQSNDSVTSEALTIRSRSPGM